MHAALVMVLERKPCVVGSGMLVAREEVTARFGFVDIQLKDKASLLTDSGGYRQWTGLGNRSL